MDNKIKHVLNGFKDLDLSQKKEFFEIIKDFEKYPHTTDGKIKESIGLEHFNESVSVNKSTVNFGPAPGGCPCCGRS